MDDQEEAKEAKNRIFQKAVAGHDDDAGLWKDSSSARVCFINILNNL